MKDYFISTDNSLFDIKKIHLLLKDCFWSKDIPIEYINRFLRFSLCFGIYKTEKNQLVGFGRVVTDYTTYAYICDVIIDPQHRNHGLATLLIKEMLEHPDLQGLKTWSLRSTNEAKNIYKNFGFKLAYDAGTLLEIDNINIYSLPTFNNLHK